MNTYIDIFIHLYFEGASERLIPVYTLSKTNSLKMRKSVKKSDMNNGKCTIIIKVIIRNNNDNDNYDNDNNNGHFRLFDLNFYFLIETIVELF
jgi:hypothetical protein